MNVALIHHSLNIPGGAERLCLTSIAAFKKEDYDVTLITVERTNWNLVRHNFGEIVLPDNERYLTNFKFSKYLSNMLGASIYFIFYIFLLLLEKTRRKYDLVMNTFGDIVNSLADITYIHFPLQAALEFSQVPAFTRTSIWRVAMSIYNVVLASLDRISPGELLTNSKFTQQLIKDTLNRRSLIVYPPVNVETLATQCFQNQKRESIVVTISSYTPKRHLERIPAIAKRTKSAQFVIMGKADEYSSPTLEKLKEQIRRLDVEYRVEPRTNVPVSEFLATLTKAKVYLHVMPFDHFGISVVEAMASGCVPVVHQSGGPWLDILNGQQGEYGFGYNSVTEAANYINTLLSNEKLRKEIASRALHRAKEFDKSVFMRRIVQVVKNVAN